jgi:hypothetical protein
MGARPLNDKDNRAANSLSAEKLQSCHTYRLLESSTNAASFVARKDLNLRPPGYECRGFLLVDSVNRTRSGFSGLSGSFAVILGPLSSPEKSLKLLDFA